MAITARARNLRQNATDAESVLWHQLRNGQLGVKFRRQHPIPPYIADFYCAEHMLIVEIDGGQHTPEIDLKRTEFLTEHGYKIIRFWNNDVLTNIEGVLTMVKKESDQSKENLLKKTNNPHPIPLPERERVKESTRVCVAEIVTVHGVRGAVKLRGYCEDLDLIDGSGPLFTAPTGDKTVSVTLMREIGADMFLAEIDNITDRTAAEKFRGTKLYLPRDLMPEIDAADTFYHVDLLNLPVFDAAGTPRGHIVSVQNFGAGDLLEIKPETGAPTYYLPFNDIYVPHVDMAAKRVTIEPADELINPK